MVACLSVASFGASFAMASGWDEAPWRGRMGPSTVTRALTVNLVIKTRRKEHHRDREAHSSALHLYTKDHQDRIHMAEPGGHKKANHQSPPKGHGPVDTFISSVWPPEQKVSSWF